MLKFPPSIKPGKHSLLGLVIDDCGAVSGGIPSYISQFTNMKELEIKGSSLDGTIPESLGNLASLEYLNLFNNSLIGTLPSTLGKLDKLTALVLGRNNFQGPLPPCAGDLDKLRLLDLSYNEFEGPLPTEFSRMSTLEHISLQHNANLNGSISAFEPLQHLMSLLLNSNSFSSTIPERLLANFTGQLFVDLGHNKFTGKLPNTFSDNAKYTSYLAIMGNNFDADAVDDVICNEVLVMNADCSSCPCCTFNCCSDDSTNANDPNCHFDLDFNKLAGLDCGAWWASCHGSYYEVDPE